MTLMKKIRKSHNGCLLFSVLVALFFLSCSEEQDKKDFVDLLSMPAIPVEGELIDEYLMTYKSYRMKFIQSKLFHFAPTEEDACLVSTENMDTIGYISGIGGGPGEMLQPYFSGVSASQDTVYMYDGMYKELFVFHVKVEDDRVNYTLLEKRSPETYKLQYREYDMKQQYFFLNRLGNGYSVASPLLTSGNIFTLFDRDLNFLTDFGEYPVDKNLFDEDIHMIANLGGSMTSDENSFYYASNFFGYITRYDISDQGAVTKVWEKHFVEPEYTIENNKVKISPKSVACFFELIVGKDYIYVSFSGIERGELFRTRNDLALSPKFLVILDKQGNVKGKFDLGKKIRTFCLDEKEEYLYVNHYEPDTSLWRYRISDFLEHF